MAIVYCIVCNITGEKYYGSTIRPLEHRLAKHKRCLDCASKQIISRGDFDIYKLSEYETREEAKIKEDWYIRNKECINKNRVKITDKEKKEYRKEYYEKNIEKMQEYNRKKIECEYCGFIRSKKDLKRHQKSKSCLTYQKKLK